MDDNVQITARQRCSFCCKYHWRGMVLLLVPLLFAPILLATPVKEMRCAYILLVMALYWVTEAIPIYITALIPIIAMPLFGIMSSSVTCMQYMKDVVVFFVVSMIVAMSVEYTNLHTRMALGFISIVGCSPRRLHFGMMTITYLVSCWVSNSAATAMLCPIAKAVLQQLDDQGLVKFNKDTESKGEDEPPRPSKVTTAFFLGIAYAASIGGCSTLIGTGTNLSVKGLYDERFPKGGGLTFSKFMFFNFPPAFIIFLLTFLWLQVLLLGLFRPKSSISQELQIGKEGENAAMDLVKQKRKELGPIGCTEIFVGFYFFLMVLLLFLMKPDIFRGYANIMDEKEIKSSAPTTVVAFLLFVTPASFAFCRYFGCKRPENDKPADTLMNYEYFGAHFPWGVPLLLGGGFALSKGIQESGFAIYLGKSLKTLTSLPHPAIQLCSILAGISFTAFSSNVAVANILEPILFEIAVIARMHPLYTALPAGMACSLAFHLPVSTPPNAIVAGIVNISTKDMAIAGIGPTLFSIIIYFAFSQFWGPVIFTGWNGTPSWLPETTRLSFGDF